MAEKQSTKIEQPCETCGKPILSSPYRINARKRRFCSRACHIKNITKFIENKCDVCGRKFRVTPSMLERSRHRFCSIECHDKVLRTKKPGTLYERFYRFVGPKEESGCILWTGALNNKGYGMIGSGGAHGKNLLVHRVAWEFTKGLIPKGMEILHNCDNPRCVNIDHLSIGTHADNMAQATSRNRMAGGERSHLSKLKDKDVMEIRRLYESRTNTQKELATMFKISIQTIHSITSRRTWRHL